MRLRQVWRGLTSYRINSLCCPLTQHGCLLPPSLPHDLSAWADTLPLRYGAFAATTRRTPSLRGRGRKSTPLPSVGRGRRWEIASKEDFAPPLAGFLRHFTHDDPPSKTIPSLLIEKITKYKAWGVYGGDISWSHVELLRDVRLSEDMPCRQPKGMGQVQGVPALTGRMCRPQPAWGAWKHVIRSHRTQRATRGGM